MTSRRNVMVTIGTVGLSLMAGCATSTSSPSETSSDDSTEPTPKPSDGQISGITAKDGRVTVSIKDGSNVDSVNLLKDGELVETSSVSTGETQTSFAFLTTDDLTGWFTSKPTGTYQLIAVDADDDQVGSAEYRYQPDIELTGVSTGSSEFPDDEESAQWLVLSVTNSGNALAAFAGMEFEYQPEKDVNNVDAADEAVPTLVRGPGLDDGKLGSSSLNTREEFGNKNRDAHLLQPGETKKFIARGFFKSYQDSFDRDALTPADFERTLNLSIYMTPAKEARTTYGVTAHLTGELKSERITGEYELWCEKSSIIDFVEL